MSLGFSTNKIECLYMANLFFAMHKHYPCFFAFLLCYFPLHTVCQICASITDMMNKKLECLSLITNARTLIYFLLAFPCFFAFFCSAIFLSTQCVKFVPPSLTCWTKKLECLPLTTNSTTLISLLLTYPSVWTLSLLFFLLQKLSNTIRIFLCYWYAVFFKFTYWLD